MNKIRFAIWGPGRIAERFSNSLAHIENAELYALIGRNQAKLEKFAQKHPVKKIYTDENTALQDPNIDAIYLALPHKLHEEKAIKALKAKKAVLCEKPAVISKEQMEEIAKASKGNDTLFMEAMKTRFIPAARKVKEMIRSGKLGTVQTIDIHMEVPAAPKTLPEGHYILDPVGGGALLDSGCYGLTWPDYLLNENPIWDDVDIQWQNGIDIQTIAKGHIGECEILFKTSLVDGLNRTLVIETDKGVLTVEELHRPVKFTWKETGKEPVEFEYPYEIDDFYSQITAFISDLKSGVKEDSIMPLRSSIAEAAAIDCLKSFKES